MVNNENTLLGFYNNSSMHLFSDLMLGKHMRARRVFLLIEQDSSYLKALLVICSQRRIMMKNQSIYAAMELIAPKYCFKNFGAISPCL